VVDVVGAAIQAMRRLGASESGVRAVLGPAICGQCYAVPSRRAEEVRQVRPEAVGVARDGQPSVDVRTGIMVRLAELGAESTVVGACTAEDSTLFSHRRDGRTGRQGGAVVIAAAA
jgi:copper oxidase (laccase) domain-containing protein